MVNRITRLCLVAAAAVTLPAAAEAQQRQVDARIPSNSRAASATREEVRGWYGELQQIGARLQQAHERALSANPQLRTTQQRIFAEIKTEMERTDPGLAQLAGRAEQIEAEARRARQAGNRDQLRTLATEASRIQARFLAAQRQVMSKPEIVSRMQAYDAQLRQQMVRAEPNLDQLIARSRDLQMRLVRAQQGGARQGSTRPRTQ